MTCSSGSVNSIAAEVLATQAAKALAAMVMTKNRSEYYDFRTVMNKPILPVPYTYTRLEFGYQCQLPMPEHLAVLGHQQNSVDPQNHTCFLHFPFNTQDRVTDICAQSVEP